MNRLSKQIPEGMQDTLPGECRQKRKVEGALRALFERSGFAEVQTPALEYCDVFAGGVSGIAPEQMYKTFDKNGRILAVRPDNTTPVMRMAVTRMQGAPLPLRLCYVQDALKYPARANPRFSQATQAGVELMGESSAEADAEVIALAVRSLLSAGLRSFQIDIGQVGFFKGLMEEAGLHEDEIEQLRGYVEEKNMLAIELTLGSKPVSDEVKRRIMRLPQLYGGPEVLDAAQAMSAAPLCQRALQNLRDVLSVLSDYGLLQYVSIDLGMVHAIDYYTGMILRGITSQLGQPLLSGGRYDLLAAGFERPMPAVGFALDIKQLLIALERQGEPFDPPVSDVLLAFAPGARAQALLLATQFRGEGRSVELCYQRGAEELSALAAQKRARCAVYVDGRGAHDVWKEGAQAWNP